MFMMRDAQTVLAKEKLQQEPGQFGQNRGEDNPAELPKGHCDHHPLGKRRGPLASVRQYATRPPGGKHPGKRELN